MPIFYYTDIETTHLKKCDKILGAAIDVIGPIERTTNHDLFSALINAIVGQQISSKARATVWQRMCGLLGEITPQAILAYAETELQSCGITFKKATYIRDIAERVADGRLDIEALRSKPDREVCAELMKLDGVGIWTAEMLMLFSMERPDILSYSDLAILRGMRILYSHSAPK